MQSSEIVWKYFNLCYQNATAVSTPQIAYTNLYTPNNSYFIIPLQYNTTNLISSFKCLCEQ